MGTALRHYTYHGAGAGRVKQVAALLRVLAVFDDKGGEKRIVTAKWFPTKHRWNYAVMSWIDAAVGSIWLDATGKSEDHGATTAP